MIKLKLFGLILGAIGIAIIGNPQISLGIIFMMIGSEFWNIIKKGE